MLILHACSSFAQHPSRPPAQVDPDSDRILDRINFHPSYTSNYSINRTSRAWGQGLNVSRRISVIDFSNRWQVTKMRDSAQSDMRQKRGMMSASADYKMARFGSWTLGLKGDFRRNAQLSSFREVVDNNSDYGLAIKTKLPELLMRRVIFPLRDFSLDTSSNLGYNRQVTSSRRSNLLDSTRVGGFFRSYSAGIKGRVAGVDLGLSRAADRRTGDSNTRQRNLDTDEIRIEDDTTENTNDRWDATLKWVPFAGLEANGSGHMVDKVSQYWDIQANDRQGAQETLDGIDRKGEFRFEWRHKQDASLGGAFAMNELSGDYELQEKDFTKQSKRGRLDGRFIIPSFVGPAAGTELTIAYSDEETENSLQQTANYRQTNRTIRFSAGKKLGAKFSVRFTEEVSLQQYFYEDRSNDRDDRRLFTDGNLSYRPSTKFNGVFNFSWTKRQAVNIPEEKAANTNTNQSYRINANLTYTRRKMSINQRYTVQADYTFYDFNEDNNRLVRTNSVNTTFRSPVARNTIVTVKHQYQYKDSGQYLRENEGEPRSYAASSEEVKHVLTLQSTYSIAKVLNIEGKQLFDQRQTTRVGSPNVNTNKRVEFTLKMNFTQDISDDFKVNMNFQQTRSNREKNYWSGQASIERRF